MLKMIVSVLSAVVMFSVLSATSAKAANLPYFFCEDNGQYYEVIKTKRKNHYKVQICERFACDQLGKTYSSVTSALMGARKDCAKGPLPQD